MEENSILIVQLPIKIQEKCQNKQSLFEVHITNIVRLIKIFTAITKVYKMDNQLNITKLNKFINTKFWSKNTKNKTTRSKNRTAKSSIK